MRTIVNYIRQIFCKHEWIYKEKHCEYEFKNGTKVYMRCKKCGYHAKHWKFI